MTGFGYTRFDTAIGACGIAWTPAGIAGLRLPGRSVEAECVPTPPDVQRVVDLVVAHLGGAKVDYGDVRLDAGRIGAWERSVYQLTRTIPPGETITYGALAERLGDPQKAQAVGQALGRNPWPIIVPCHRVTAADGRMGGFSAPGGRETKLRLLEIEGACGAEALPLFGASIPPQ